MPVAFVRAEVSASTSDGDADALDRRRRSSSIAVAGQDRVDRILAGRRLIFQPRRACSPDVAPAVEPGVPRRMDGLLESVEAGMLQSSARQL
ncbi:MAG: hypothetical protein WDW38_006469 [Sanguina aurantia]